MVHPTLAVIAHSGWSEVWLLGGLPLAAVAAWELWDRRRRTRCHDGTERDVTKA